MSPFKIVPIPPVGGLFRIIEKDHVLFDTEEPAIGARRTTAEVFMNYWSWALTSVVGKVHGIDSNGQGCGGSIPRGYKKTVEYVRVSFAPFAGNPVPAKKPVDVELWVGTSPVAAWKQRHGTFWRLEQPQVIEETVCFRVVLKNLPRSVWRVRVELHGPLLRPIN